MKSKRKSNSKSARNSYSLDFLPEVEFDVDDAYSWYESQRDGLGDEFLHEIESCLVKIKRNPLTFQESFNFVRRALVRRFPFGVFFVIEDHKITVTAIIHLARHPKTWKVRRKR